ncbi:hypothetical protein G7046_g2405 [Stylonectria norvegica]|nr:hypothetical protein G7046_g2405 [Stylonectria norvegica]
MRIKNKIPEVGCISTPTVITLPETEKSRSIIIEPYHVDLLPEYGYVSREYLISGVAAGLPYCTRILLRCPADSLQFSGFVVEEPSHLWGGTSIWRHINRWLMRNGHAWLEVDSQAPSAIEKIKNVNPERYEAMHFIPSPLSSDFAENIPFTTAATKETLRQEYASFKSQWWPATNQSPEVIAAASYALRSGQLGLVAARVVLSGLSQTGGVTRRFITHSSHIRLPNGNLPFEAFIPCQSGGMALPDLPGVKIVELLGEAEFLSVRFPCGISGQMSYTDHRRPESDSFRTYEVAGMAHRESRYASAVDKKRWSDADLRGARWSTFANSFIYHAVFEAVEEWTSERGIPPPPSATLQITGSCDDILRDEHENAVGGGSEWPFASEKLQKVYGSLANYRRIAGQAIERQIRAGFLLPADAEVLRRETIEEVHF